MYNPDTLLSTLRVDNPDITLTNIAFQSFKQFRESVADTLSWGETRALYQEAQRSLRASRVFEARLLSRANPQLQQALHLEITRLREDRSYNDMFGGRADSYAVPGSVASMFSPAAYLTEMYREARELHASGGMFHLDVRRPNLSALMLSQHNMDEEVTTLALSNEILMDNLQATLTKSNDDVLQQLATYRYAAETPYHSSYEMVRSAILIKDPELSIFSDNPVVAERADFLSMTGILSDISPELYNILTENITSNNISELMTRNFGDIGSELLRSPEFLMRYYSLTAEEINKFLAQSQSNNLQQQYINNQFTTITTVGGKLTALQITSNGTSNTSQFNYMEVIPTGGNKFNINFSVTSTYSGMTRLRIGTGGGESSDLLLEDNFTPQKNVPYTRQVTFDFDRLLAGITIGIARAAVPGGGYVYSARQFKAESYSLDEFLLRLNKLIRLYKATGIQPEDLQQIILSVNDDENIDAAVLKKIFLVKYYQLRYDIDIEEALALANTNISQRSTGDRATQFDRLFNTPLLVGREFALGGGRIEVHPGTVEYSDTFRRGVLKRAFEVDDAGLYTMRRIADYQSTLGIDNSLVDLSDLYFIYLLAKVHKLTISQLYLLLQISPFSTRPVFGATDEQLRLMVDWVYNTTRWLAAQKWTVYELWLMASTDYPDEVTPEIENLITTLRNGLAAHPDAGDKEYADVLAPYLAAAFGLESSQLGFFLVRWINQEDPGGIGVAGFIKLVQKETPTEEEWRTLASYSQAMMRLTLIISLVPLSEAELDAIFPGQTRLGHDVATIIRMTRFHALVNRSGSGASRFLSALQEGRQDLTPALLAEVLQADPVRMQQALKLVATNATLFSNWLQVDSAIQWLNVADKLNVTPDDIARLLAIKYVAAAGETLPDWEAWKKMANVLVAGLTPQESDTLYGQLDERLSGALCGYYLREVRPELLSRDDLFQYLLIDNQVSAQVKTTRIAEAIASVQLYVNRALSGAESGVKKELLTNQYFKDWRSWNRRYSTWNGVSQLAYYPENYIDPTARIGQTGMMDALLQSVSQLGINADTVEDAFRTYLTSFEQVANLEVISGYHDNISVSDGLTYFVGRNNSETLDYYWRSVDHSKMQDGQFVANAWSEWRKIDCAVNPYSNLVRPVIFNNRLYLLWLERTARETLDEGSGISLSTEYNYNLKVSHIRYDGSWSAPLSYDVTADIQTVISGINSRDNKKLDEERFVPGFYISCDNGTSYIQLVFYELRASHPPVLTENDKKNVIFSGHYITLTMDYQAHSADYRYTLYEYSRLQYDTTDVRRVINRYAEVYDVNPTIRDANSTVFSDLLSLDGSQIREVKITNISGNSFNFNFSGSVRLNTLPVTTYTPLEDFIKQAISANYSEGDNAFFYSLPLPLIKGGKSGLTLLVIVNLTQSNVIVLTFQESSRKVVAPYSYSLGLNVGKKAVITAISDKPLANPPYFYKKLDSDTLAAFSNNGTEKTISLIAGFQVLGTSNEDGVSLVAQLGNPQVSSYDPKNIKDIRIKAVVGGKTVEKGYGDWSTAGGTLNVQLGANHWDLKTFTISGASSSGFKDDIGPVDITLSVQDINNKTVIAVVFHTEIRRLLQDTGNVMSINRLPSDAQYLDLQGKRTRLNTLFARQLIERANIGIDTILSWETQQIQEPGLQGSGSVPMDFSGANALYFWELFYYTPMLVAQRLAQEEDFDEAERWLNYVYNPRGYADEDGNITRYWNVRPLQEDTSWNDDPLDSVDPDAVAQNDPMHYKVATFMAYVNMLLTRGDLAYRQLDRDSLNEAKMWYMQALQLLGPEPYLDLSFNWANPTLGNAARLTRQEAYYQAVNQLRLSDTVTEPLTANSVAGLFLPQQNEKLYGFWRTLAQRLYNLRHNLSITGQPLSLPVYARPADPAALLTAAVSASQGGATLPTAFMPLYRFSTMLESARNMVGQLTTFGSTLQGILERQDSEALSELTQRQGQEMMVQSLQTQQSAIEVAQADITALREARAGAQSRFDSYSRLYNENVSDQERESLSLRQNATVLNTASTGLFMGEGLAELVPNIYGMAVGGSRYGAVPRALAIGLMVGGTVLEIQSDKIGQSEIWRRRREEWEIARNSAEAEVRQLDAQIATAQVRQQTAELQKTQLETQQQQAQAQLEYLQRKFNNQALYSWLRGQLAAIYYQFYDQTVSRCLMAQAAFQWETGLTTSFIRAGAWQGSYAGLTAGETLMANLAQMEDAWLRQETRWLEVNRTVSLSQQWAGSFNLAEQVEKLVDAGKGSIGTTSNGLSVNNGQLVATVKLSDLNIRQDYPDNIGQKRLIKSISVTLPLLLGPYEDIQATLSYGGSVVLPQGCNTIAVSSGIADSGQFQLDFSDNRYLPFEGIPVDDTGTFSLSFPNVSGRQQQLLRSMSDIVLHIQYTIRPV